MIYRSERQVFCLTRFPSAKHKGKFSFQCLVSGTVYGRNYKIGNNRVSVAECILVYMWLLVVWRLDDSFRWPCRFWKSSYLTRQYIQLILMLHSTLIMQYCSATNPNPVRIHVDITSHETWNHGGVIVIANFMNFGIVLPLKRFPSTGRMDSNIKLSAELERR
jgi:hypothetical protein